MSLVCYKQCRNHYETKQYTKHSETVMLSNSRSHARPPEFSLSQRNCFIMASKLLKRLVQTSNLETWSVLFGYLASELGLCSGYLKCAISNTG